MAYVSQELKAKLAPAIKAVCKKYGVKASLAVRNHSTLCLNISSGKIDFIGNYSKGESAQVREREITHLDVNPYWYQDHFTGKAKKFLDEVMPLMYGPDYYDHSDLQTDYFNCSHYIDVNVGRWNKPYTVTK